MKHEDPHECANRFHDPDCAEIRNDLRAKLESNFDLVAVSDHAFEAQSVVRARELDALDENQLAAALAPRLGEGQARALARRFRYGKAPHADTRTTHADHAFS